jgi:hypothetical protein
LTDAQRLNGVSELNHGVGGEISVWGATSGEADTTSTVAVVTAGTDVVGVAADTLVAGAVASVVTTSGEVVRNCLVAAAFLAAALCCLVPAFLAAALNFRVFAAFFAIAFTPPGRDPVAMAFGAAARLLACVVFLPAALNFRVRAAFFAAKLRFVGMGVPFVSCTFAVRSGTWIKCGRLYAVFELFPPEFRARHVAGGVGLQIGQRLCGLPDTSQRKTGAPEKVCLAVLPVR